MNKILILLMCVLVLTACQEATQPSDLTATRTMTVELRNNKKEPIPDALVAWQKFTGLHAPLNGNAVTGEDGFAKMVISDVATRRDSIRVVIDPPDVVPYAGVAPVQFETWVCSDTLVSLSVSEQIPCGTIAYTDTLVLEACPENGPVTVTECRFYNSSCPPGLRFTASDSAASDISIAVDNSGTSNAAAQVCVAFRPTTPDQTEQQFSTTIEGRDPANNTVQIRIQLLVIGRVNCTSCPCPDFQEINYTTKTVCINTENQITLPLDSLTPTLQGGSDCTFEFTLEEPQNDSEFEIVSTGSFTIRGGQTPPDADVVVRPQQAGTMNKQLRYKVKAQRSNGGSATECDPRYVVNVTVPVVSGNCRVEPLNTDTLKKCVFSDSATTDTVYLVNDGDCEVNFDVSVDRNVFDLSESGNVSVKPHSRLPIIVRFMATKDDWDANSANPTGPRGEKPFTANLRIRGCDTVDIPLRGTAWVICSAFKYQCLRQFRPPSFPDVYAESIQLVENKTDIVYQNDNQTFKVYDIYIRSVTGGPNYNIELGSGNDQQGNSLGRFYRVATGFTINPGESICDTYPNGAQADCNSMKFNFTMGQNPSMTLNVGDVVLFVKEAGQQCALIWIQSVGPDRPGPNSLPSVCMEICYPVFTL